MVRKYSRQRECIRNFMTGRTDHPTADIVYSNVKREMPNISLGTVYRNLMLLSDEGELARVDVGDGVVHFDPDTSVHYHFVCDSCGAVIDIPYRDFRHINDEVSDTFGGRITGHKIFFNGLCPDCVKMTARKAETV